MNTIIERIFKCLKYDKFVSSKIIYRKLSNKIYLVIIVRIKLAKKTPYFLRISLIENFIFNIFSFKIRIMIKIMKFVINRPTMAIFKLNSINKIRKVKSLENSVNIDIGTIGFTKPFALSKEINKGLKTDVIGMIIEICNINK
jgi:hypothetical protein